MWVSWIESKSFPSGSRNRLEVVMFGDLPVSPISSQAGRKKTPDALFKEMSLAFR